MKTKYILALATVIILLFSGCTQKDNIDLKLTIAPEAKTLVSSEDMNSASRIISSRLTGSLGIPAENIKTEVDKNLISLTVSKTRDSQVDSIRKLITGYAKLEFYETFENAEITGMLMQANNFLKGLQENSAMSDKNPLLEILKPMLNQAGEPMSSCMIGLADIKDTATVNRYLETPQVKKIFPPEIRFAWSRFPYKYDTSGKMIGLHAIRLNSPVKAPVDGSMIVSAALVNDVSDPGVKLQLTFNAEGTGKFAALTRANVNRCIAVVNNGFVRAYPRVQDEIPGGKIEITGDFTREEANDLLTVFKSGQLPFRLKVINEQVMRE